MPLVAMVVLWVSDKQKHLEVRNFHFKTGFSTEWQNLSCNYYLRIYLLTASGLVQKRQESSLSKLHRARQYKLYPIISQKFWHSAFCTMKSESWSVGRFPCFSGLHSNILTKLTLCGTSAAVSAEHAWVGKAEEGAHGKQSLSWLEHSGQVHLANNPLKPHKR